MFGTKLRLALILLPSGFAVWSAVDGLPSRAVISLAGAVFLAWEPVRVLRRARAGGSRL